MSFIKEFRDFALKGNVMDLAVGVIIGAAFGKIVTSLVDNILMPVIGVMSGGVNFNDKFVLLSDKKGTDFPSLAAAKAAGAPAFAYGAFIQSVIDFIIIALCIFMLVKFVNKITRRKDAVPDPTASEKLLMEIRDAIKSK